MHFLAQLILCSLHLSPLLTAVHNALCIATPSWVTNPQMWLSGSQNSSQLHFTKLHFPDFPDCSHFHHHQSLRHLQGQPNPKIANPALLWDSWGLNIKRGWGWSSQECTGVFCVETFFNVLHQFPHHPPKWLPSDCLPISSHWDVSFIAPTFWVTWCNPIALLFSRWPVLHQNFWVTWCNPISLLFLCWIVLPQNGCNFHPRSEIFFQDKVRFYNIAQTCWEYSIYKSEIFPWHPIVVSY